MTDLIGGAMTLAVLMNLVGRDDRRQVLETWRRVTIGMAVQSVGVIFAVVLSVFVVESAFPILDWSWLSLVGSESTNINMEPLRHGVSVIAVMFWLSLMATIPTFARWEEDLFRQGTRTWPQAMRRSVVFGLVHCVVGVPLSAGLALTLPGLWLSRQYMRGGIQHSTAHHSVYNWMVCTIIAALMVTKP